MNRPRPTATPPTGTIPASRRPSASGALALAASLLLTAIPAAGQLPGPRTADGTRAFVGVSIVHMNDDGSAPVWSDQTVVVRDGVITAVGPAAEVTVPEGASVVDGTGRWLMPGLAEMHAHVPPVQGDGWPPREDVEEMMFLYLANGITTIRGMLGAPYQLDLREELASGEMLGPSFQVGALSLNGNRAPDPESAERLVRRHAEAGYDLQKIHPGLARATWDRMAEVADEVGLTFAGHVPAAVGLEHALATGMSTVDHLDGYVLAVASDDVRSRSLAGENVPLEEVVASATDARIAEVARATREAGTWVVPTMYLWENLLGSTDADRILAGPEMVYVSQAQRDGWRRQAARRSPIDAEVERAHNELRKRILLALSEVGAGVLMGTDSPQMFNVPGFALHREIRIMADAGMSNLDILASGTRNVARYAEEDLGLSGEFGRVAPGMRADLVLLDADPLEDLANLTERAGVMVRGRWIPGDEIEAGLAELARRHAGG